MTHTLQINSKKYPFKLSIRAMMTFAQSFQGNGEEIDLTNSDDAGKMFESQLNMIHSGLKVGAQIENKEFNLSVFELEMEFTEDPSSYIAATELMVQDMPKLNGKKKAGAK